MRLAARYTRSNRGAGVSLEVLFRALTLAALTATAAVTAGPAPHRIVSLAPSLTEDLFAIGAGPEVVGVSSYTDFPPQATRLPVVATFASVDTERLVALRPDVVVGLTTQAQLVADARRAGVRVALYDDDSFPSIFRDLRALGALTGHATQAERLAASLHARTIALVRNVPHHARRPSVFVVLGTAPIFTVGAGSYIATLIDLAGGRNAAADVKAPYARYSPDALVARQPDVLVVDPTIRFADVQGSPPWNVLRAVQQHRVYTLPDPAILERPGPRYNDGLAWLIAKLSSASAP